MMDTCSEAESAQYMIPCTPNDREMMLMLGRRDLPLNVYLEHFDSCNFANLTSSEVSDTNTCYSKIPTGFT
jgi:hypothetical protein